MQLPQLKQPKSAPGALRPPTHGTQLPLSLLSQGPGKQMQPGDEKKPARKTYCLKEQLFFSFLFFNKVYKVMKYLT